MANVTKTVSGAVSTFVITDNAGSTLTLAVTSGTVTGLSTAFTSSGGLHVDGMQELWNLLNAQLIVDIIPGSGAQGLMN
jgi:hypothetical protein